MQQKKKSNKEKTSGESMCLRLKDILNRNEIITNSTPKATTFHNDSQFVTAADFEMKHINYIEKDNSTTTSLSTSTSTSTSDIEEIDDTHKGNTYKVVEINDIDDNNSQIASLLIDQIIKNSINDGLVGKEDETILPPQIDIEVKIEKEEDDSSPITSPRQQQQQKDQNNNKEEEEEAEDSESNSHKSDSNNSTTSTTSDNYILIKQNKCNNDEKREEKEEEGEEKKNKEPI
jgi:hypothetical protein